MAGPLLKSKYRLPTPGPGVVARARLASRLSAALRTPVTVVSAPAGFGKTTLLSEWLADAAAESLAVAWLSLDRLDNDPALFWTYVVTAVQAAVPGRGDVALQLLGSSSSPPIDTALASLLNDLEGVPHDLVLALDDYHVIESPQVHESLRFIIEHQPARLHLVIAARADPPLQMAQLRARGRLLEVRASDLRFTADEAAAYLNDSIGLALGSADVAALEERTEGWIAALQLAGLSLRGREDASAFIAGFAGDDRYIIDYLAEEVLARQPAEIRDFLLKTSILERLTGSLCDAVTGHQDGVARLVALERANLFLVPLDDRRQWYRYHHLFADVLQAHLQGERPDRMAGVHRRASAWFEAHDEVGQAIRHAHAAGDTDRAADLMELATPMMFRERREAELARWLSALPDEVVGDRPVLGVAFVGALAQAFDFDTVGERLAGIEAALRSSDGSWPQQPPPHLIVVDLDQYRSLPARIAMYRAALSLVTGKLDDTITYATDALALTPGDDALTRAAAGALGGLASWTTGDLPAAHAAYTESAAGLASIGFLADVLGCTITLGDLLRTQGRLAAAVRTYQHALELTAPSAGAEPLRGSADMHTGLAGVLLERNDVDAAREQLTVSQHLGEHNGLPQNAYRSRVVMAHIREIDGDLDAALDLLDEAERVYAGDYSPEVAPVPAVRARLRLRRGEFDLAQQWARERHLTASDDPSYMREYEHLTLVRVMVTPLLAGRQRAGAEARDLADALSLLGRLLAAAERGGRGASVIEVLVLQALTYQAGRNRPAALAALARAVNLAQPERYMRLFADEGAPMTNLLTALRRQHGAPSYATDLLAAMSGSVPHTTAPQDLVDPLSERELDVLRLLGSDLGGPDIARELSVSLNTLRTHTKNIYAKLGVTSRRDAVRQGRELHLTPGHRHR